MKRREAPVIDLVGPILQLLKDRVNEPKCSQEARYDIKPAVLALKTVSTPPVVPRVPGDLEKYAATSKAALLINSCEMDWQFGPEKQAKADEIFANFEPGSSGSTLQATTMGLRSAVMSTSP
ncbi:hypothetical protein C8J57DRAFT_1220462 [Mycena rebaudengoi]|nr:hypothetical protein C8J57DRAFT_1220462 [Mycena rebaudengoi]